MIARWESRGGKHYAELYHTATGYGYRGNGCGGSLATVATAATAATAVTIMQARVDSGYFLPDKAVLPMVRVV